MTENLVEQLTEENLNLDDMRKATYLEAFSKYPNATTSKIAEVLGITERTLFNDFAKYGMNSKDMKKYGIATCFMDIKNLLNSIQANLLLSQNPEASNISLVLSKLNSLQKGISK